MSKDESRKRSHHQEPIFIFNLEDTFLELNNRSLQDPISKKIWKPIKYNYFEPNITILRLVVPTPTKPI